MNAYNCKVTALCLDGDMLACDEQFYNMVICL